MTNTVLITGSNRGIGLEFVKQYLNLGWQVLATCRVPDDAKDLQHIASQNPLLKIYPLDVTKLIDIENLAVLLKEESIDLLINNAGIYGNSEQNFGNISIDNMKKTYLTNTVGPLKMVENFMTHISKSHYKTIVTISSIMGSITDNTYAEAYAYCTSKAALNMGMKCLSNSLRDKATILILHPGWVKTDMGGQGADIDTETSVAGMIKVIEDKFQGKKGLFFSYTGEELPW